MVDSSSWFSQSRFAMDGDWIGLSKWAIDHGVAAMEPVAKTNPSGVKEDSSSDQTKKTAVGSASNDNLTKINGLGKASQKVLNKNGIHSFAQVASMTSQQLDTLFAASKKRFQLIKTSTWPAQARQFASTESNQEVSSGILEAEILDEIDSIRDMASDVKSSSSASSKKEQTSKRG